MLKNIRNNSDLIRLEDQAPASDEESPSSSYDKERDDRYQACLSALATAEKNLPTLEQAWNDAKKMLERYDKAIEEYTKRQKSLIGEDGESGIMKQYSDFQDELNTAWTSKESLNGYDEIYGENGTIDCLKNFGTAISSLLSTLSENQAKWVTKEKEAKEAYDAANAIIEAGCSY